MALILGLCWDIAARRTQWPHQRFILFLRSFRNTLFKVFQRVQKSTFHQWLVILWGRPCFRSGWRSNLRRIFLWPHESSIFKFLHFCLRYVKNCSYRSGRRWWGHRLLFWSSFLSERRTSPGQLCPKCRVWFRDCLDAGLFFIDWGPESECRSDWRRLRSNDRFYVIRRCSAWWDWSYRSWGFRWQSNRFWPCSWAAGLFIFPFDNTIYNLCNSINFRFGHRF